MKNKSEELRKIVQSSLNEYDPTEEFGISKEAYKVMMKKVDEFFHMSN